MAFGVSPFILIPIGLVVEAMFIKIVGKSIKEKDIIGLDYKKIKRRIIG